MRRDVFIETRNVMDFRQKVRALEDFSGEPGFALVFGQAGRGKTETARHYHAMNGGIFLRVMQGWSQCAFLQELCFQVCGLRPRSSATCKAKIIEALDSMPQTLFVDEADRLHVDRVEDLRDVFDLTSSTVVLIGEQELRGLLSTRRRIWSRVKQVVEFGPVAEEDVAILGDEAAGLDIAPEACSQIVRLADGDFRLVWSFIHQLELTAKTHGIQQINTELVARVSKLVASWRQQ
ncbi:hypothetical protein Dde_3351 [Oleidesulfovibrio alaskensis G20]|jgi:DNA transposition AAA+ family ATPase|uniref:ORC1/DEAH AAA+ ATPase domain-containing protein n=2 Tax=Oleidesulfovibrio alaskensis TaxID=58180 RepID=Q30W01_OLEA2|nr:AAA family ATPase [Oleidesulfovibrio alaskensis]ABB40145.1 hypothetical protein Dde_3351 [Oleidesulfovibrio alaskensis G20]MBL3580882.1 AAA family ATPase [Oleidesulfovibrio alaskensis]MBL3587983.1 AAA family ATPase [bacterium]